MNNAFKNLREKGRFLVLAPAAYLAASPISAFAQEADPQAQAAQTTLLGKVSTWGGVGLLVIAAIVGFAMAFSMLKRAK